MGERRAGYYNFDQYLDEPDDLHVAIYITNNKYKFFYLDDCYADKYQYLDYGHVVFHVAIYIDNFYQSVNKYFYIY